MNGNIAIVAAVSGELKPLVRHRTARSWKRLASASGTWVWEYQHAQGRWLAVCAGMGAARAATALAEAERNMTLDAVCSVGWAGSLSEAFRAEKVYAPAEVVDSATGQRFRPAHWSAAMPILVSTGKVADAAEKRRLAATYSAGLVDMEAAAVARIAQEKSIPFYCLKAISDDADAEMPDIEPFLDESGQIRMLPFLAHTAVRPSSWGGLARLGRHSAAAAVNLAESIYDWLDERAYIRKEIGDYSN